MVQCGNPVAAVCIIFECLIICLLSWTQSFIIVVSRSDGLLSHGCSQNLIIGSLSVTTLFQKGTNINFYRMIAQLLFAVDLKILVSEISR